MKTHLLTILGLLSMIGTGICELEIVCASNKVVECGTAWSFDSPTVITNSCTNFTLTVLSTQTNGVDPCATNLTRIWEATDCGTNTVTCTQIVSVLDTTPPVITCASNKTVECGSVWAFDPPVATDACCDTNLTILLWSSNSTVVDPCLTEWEGVWQVTDCCSNSITCTQTVFEVDTTPPIITGCPTNRIIGAGSNGLATIPDMRGELVATDNCGSLAVTQDPPGGAMVGPGIWPVVFTVCDPCTNCVQCTNYVTVELDCNENGIPDSIDISTGTSLDCDGNGVPDECCGQPDQIVVAGTRDDFTGVEPTVSRPELAAICSPSRGFDENVLNRCFGQTISGLCSNITAATLEIRMRPNATGSGGSVSENDTISLQACGSGFAWGRRIGTVSGVPGLLPADWRTYTNHTFTLDLAALPLVSGGTVSILELIDQVHALDIYVQDDTEVDYVELTVACCADCNSNDIPDSCEIATGQVVDANANGIPDDCECVPPSTNCCVDVVFLLDTSGSMNDDAAALCNGINQILAGLGTSGVQVSSFNILATVTIPSTPAYSCVSGLVSSFGTSAGGLPLTGCTTPQGNQENWGVATAIIAENYPWSPDCQRLIIPISDEGPSCGDPCVDPGSDRLALDVAIASANAQNVIVSPVLSTRSGNLSCVRGLMQDLAAATGGSFADLNQGQSFVDTITDVVRAACFSCTEPPPGMVAWWPFDETSGGFAHDIEGGHFGVWTDYGVPPGPTPILGEYVANSLRFDGVDDHVRVPHAGDGSLDFATSSFSIDAWIKIDAAKDSMTLVDKRNPANNAGYWLFLTNDCLALSLSDGSPANTFYEASAACVPMDTNWHLVAVTIDRGPGCLGNVVKFYLDGLLYSTFPLPTALGSLANTYDLYIASHHPALLCDDDFAGCIDELELVGRVLTLQEICDLYRAGALGKCKKNIQCNDFCIGNLIPNGSFECGTGAACPPGGGGLGGLFDWISCGTDVADWVGESSNGDCVDSQTSKFFKNKGVPHAPPSDTQAAKKRKRCLTGMSPRTYGARFVHLDRDRHVFSGPDEAVACVAMLQPVMPGFKYDLSFWAIRNRGKSPTVRLIVGNQPTIWSPNGKKKAVVVIHGDAKCWQRKAGTFTATPAHAANNTFRIQAAEQADGVCVDAVCLRPIGGGNVRGSWPFDGGSGSGIGGSAWVVNGTPQVTDGQVDLALTFDGLNDYTFIDADPELAVGTNDLSLATWINPGSLAQSYIPLVDARDTNGFGYVLYLDLGRPALQLTDSTGSQQFVANQAVSSNEWSSIAVVLERDNSEDGLGVWINGQLVDTFDPTGIQGDLGQNITMRFAAGNPLSGPGALAYFDGAMDDTVLYGTALSEEDVIALAAEGVLVRPLDFAQVPTLALFCGTNDSVLVELTICNDTDASQTYEWELLPIAADESDEVDVDGPTEFSASAGLVTVGPNACVSIPVTIGRPSGLVPGLHAGYSFEVLNQGSGIGFDVAGLLQAPARWCVTPVSTGVLLATSGIPAMVSFEVANLSDTNEWLVFDFGARLDGAISDFEVQLNGMPAETDFPSSVFVPVGQSAIVSVDATVITTDSSVIHEIQVIADADSSGAKRPLAATRLGLLPSVAASCDLVITDQPADLTIQPGEPALFSVAASSASPLTYQWYKDGIPLADGGPITGATTNTLEISLTSLTNAGEYDVTVSNACGSLASAVAALSVDTPNLLLITNLSSMGTTFSFDCLTVNGVDYVVEYKAALDDSSWLQLTNFTGTGNPWPVLDSTTNGTSRFYRIRIP